MKTATHISSNIGNDELDRADAWTVGAPVSTGWQEATLTRANELEELSKALAPSAGSANGNGPLDTQVVLRAIDRHVKAAKDAARWAKWLRRPRKPSLIERAMSNLDAAEAQLLNVAPPEYVLGQMPSLLNQVQRHLESDDQRRKNFEHLAEKLGVKDPDVRTGTAEEMDPEDKKRLIILERAKIASAVRGAGSAALREQLQVRSFRNVVAATIVAMTLLAIGIGILGFVAPEAVPLCFQPESDGQTVLVCPTAQSVVGPVPDGPRDMDPVVKSTAQGADLLVVELIGLTAAAVAATAALHGIRGSSERYGLPVALAVLKLPTGAVTAVLGLLLMRGQFVPGLSALDTSGQILAWALVFGYAQQLFTRLVDQQAHTVLDRVRGANKPATT